MTKGKQKNPQTRPWKTALWLFCITLASAVFSLGQTSVQAAGETLIGKVTAASGSAVPNARISIQNTAGGAGEFLTSAQDGSYALAGLAPGTYQITASAPGFAQTSTTVTVNAGAAQEADLVLQAEADAEVEQDLRSTSRSGEGRSSQAVAELPLNGRSATDVAALEPGVLRARTQSRSGANGFGRQMAIFGGRPRQNSSRLDGISVNDYANGPPGNAMGITLGVDALERLTVLTRNDQAQYGRSSGGYISSTTSSGSNNLHGSVFEFYRNSALDARNYFDLEKPPFYRHQFGVSLGGPIWKDRIFFFGAYEGIRQSQGDSNSINTPSQAARAGILSASPDPIQIDPDIKRFLDAFYPLPNAGVLGTGDIGRYINSGQQVTPGNHVTARFDHILSGHDSLFGAYTFESGSNTSPDRFIAKRTVKQSRGQILRLGHTHTFSPRLLNSFRFGMFRVVASTGNGLPGQNPLAGDTSYGSVPDHTHARIRVPGLSMLGAGVDGAVMYNFHWTSIQAYDDVSLTKGSHALKFGVAIERMRDNIAAINSPSGEFSFNSLADFLSNRPSTFSATLPGTLLGRSFRQTVVGAYFQDDWVVRPNLTLALGLRYEMATVPTEANGRLTALRNLADPAPQVGRPLFSNPTLRNFAPRVGFAWDPFHNGRSIISSGFGIFDVLPLPYEVHAGELFAAPFFLTGSATSLPPLSFPTGAYDIALQSTTGFSQAYFEPHPKRNYVMQWNLTTQWRLPKDISLKAGYVGSRGVHHIFRVSDANIVLPTPTPAGYLWPYPYGSGTRLNPNAGRIPAAFWEGDSFYHALVLSAQARIRRGLFIAGSYTWGKSIDTSSGSIDGNEYSNALSSPLWFDTRLNRGQSDYDISQNVKIIYSWQLPSPRWTSGVAAWPLSGWQIGGVFEANTGVPFTVGFGGDPLGMQSTESNVSVPDVLAIPGCQSLVNPGNFVSYIKTNCFQVPRSAPAIADRCVHVVNIDPATGQSAPDPSTCLNLLGNLGRNRLIGPGRITLDSSVFKNNFIQDISRTFNVQFRAEIFNIFNRPNINAPLPNRYVFDSNGHPISSAGLTEFTQTSPRNIQFAIRVIW
jgi:hypothetical protein